MNCSLLVRRLSTQSTCSVPRDLRNFFFFEEGRRWLVKLGGLPHGFARKLGTVRSKFLRSGSVEIALLSPCFV